MPAKLNTEWWVRPEVLIVLLVSVIAAAFAVSVLSYSEGHWLLPLDDSYIYLTYARNLADGHLFRFNVTDPPTSGATSLLYPVLLALGAFIGLDGTALAVFAFCLNAGLAAALGVALYRMLTPTLMPPNAMLATLCVLLSGPLMWGILSGMEIGACVAVFLLTASSLSHDLEHGRIRWSSAWMSMLVVMRPEALVFVLLVVCLLVGFRAHLQPRLAQLRLLVVPVAMAAFELAFLWWLTGKPFPSTAPPKSPLFTPEFSVAFILQHATNFCIEILGSLLAGATDLGSLGPLNRIDTAALFPPLALLLFILGSAPLVGSELQARKPRVHTLLTLWFLFGGIVVAVTSGNGTHHFRYLHPFLVGFLVHLIPGARTFAAAFTPALTRTAARAVSRALIVLVLFFQVLTLVNFGLLFGQGARGFLPYLEVATWARHNTPRTARIAALDVGLIGFYSDRYIFDVWGLVTPKSEQTVWYFSDYAGSTYEYIENLPVEERPQYFFVHRVRFDEHGDEGHLDPFRQVLVYRATSLTYAFPAAGLDLGLYAVQWPDPEIASLPRDAGIVDEITATKLSLADTIDVADCRSEAAHSYRVWADAPAVFPSNRVVTWIFGGLTVIDGTAGVLGGERFTMNAFSDAAAMLVLRTPSMATPALVTINGTLVGSLRSTPDLGHRGETGVWIPPGVLHAGPNRIEVSGRYASAHYWLFQQ